MMNLLRRLRRPPADCRAVGRQLQAYLDGEIDHGRRAEIAAHLDACRDCGLEFSTYREIKDSLERDRPDLALDALDRLRQFGQDLSSTSESVAGSPDTTTPGSSQD